MINLNGFILWFWLVERMGFVNVIRCFLKVIGEGVFFFFMEVIWRDFFFLMDKVIVLYKFKGNYWYYV